VLEDKRDRSFHMIQEGELIFIYVSDIGGEVQPKELEGRLEKYGKTCRERVAGSSWIEEGIRILVKDEIEICGLKSRAEIKVFSIGGILVRINVPIKNKDFASTLEIISTAEDGKEGIIVNGIPTTALAEYAKDIARRVKEDIKPFITSQYSNVDYEERYRVIIVREGDRDLIEKSKKEMVGLVRKEPFDRLGLEEVEEISSTHYAYRENFFIADIRGAFGFVKSMETFPVLRAIELELLQKLELRVYDFILDEMLGKSYDILAKAESKASRRLGERINDIHLMRLELLEIVSAMRGTRGSTRARIFSALCETIGEVFEVQDLVDSVTRKLDKLGEIYTMVYDSLQNTRFIRMDRTMLILEAIIVALILFEIVLVLMGK
jgi:hypothetical protein